MRIALYARVSTQQQTERQTIEQQLERLQAYVQAQGWSVSGHNIFRDDGYSGASLQRPGLRRLRQLAAEAEFDRVILTTPDRLARNYVHLVLLVEELRSFECEVEFLDRPLSQDPHEELLLQIRGAVAQYERNLIAERMRRGRQMKLRAGLMLPWSKAPYGYQLDLERPRDPRGVRLNEVKAVIVRELFATYNKGGVSLAELTKQLQAQGVPTPTGKGPWRVPSVRAILTNPVYSGKVWAGRWRTREATRRRSALKPVGRENESRDRQPSADWILVAEVPALISPEEFALAQAKLEENKQRARRNNKANQYLLRALVSCGRCQLSCAGRSDRGGYSYYFCRGKADPSLSGLTERCRSRAIPVKELDELVWQDLSDLIQEPTRIEAAIRRIQQGEWQPQQIKARQQNLRRGQVKLGNQQERLTEAYLQGVIELAEYQRRRTELAEKITALELQEKQLAVEVNRTTEISEKVASITEFCHRVRAGLAAATFEQKRRLVELLIDRVVVTNDEVEIRYVIPTSPTSEKTRFCHLRTDYLERFTVEFT